MLDAPMGVSTLRDDVGGPASAQWRNKAQDVPDGQFQLCNDEQRFGNQCVVWKVPQNVMVMCIIMPLVFIAQHLLQIDTSAIFSDWRVIHHCDGIHLEIGINEDARLSTKTGDTSSKCQINDKNDHYMYRTMTEYLHVYNVNEHSTSWHASLMCSQSSAPDSSLVTMLSYWNDDECGTSDGDAAPARAKEDHALQTLAADRNGTTTLEFRNASIVQSLDFAADCNGIMALNSWNAVIVQSQTRSAVNTASAFRGVRSGRLEMPNKLQWNQGSIIVTLCGLTTCVWQPPSWVQDQLIRQLYTVLYKDNAGHDFVRYLHRELKISNGNRTRMGTVSETHGLNVTEQIRDT
jgi:hypothetical protein